MASPAPPVLTTKRLILRPLALADAPAVQAIFPRWEIVQFLAPGVPWPYPEDGAETYIRDFVLPGMAAGGEWHWSIRRRAEPERLIGVLSLWDMTDHNRGFWLDPAWHGQGLMTEASDVTLAYWFETLGKPVFRVPKAIANHASRRISERSGMRVVWTGERDYVSGRHAAELWEITAEEWLQRRRPNR